MPAHAKLSPSAASRWLRCTISPEMEAKVPRQSSTYADEGTLAHEWCALELERIYKRLQPKFYDQRMAAIKSHELYSPEMWGYVNTYVNYINVIMDIDAIDVRIEDKVSMEPVIPNVFGTADCIIYIADHIHIVDFKYGKGVRVDADHNEQLMLYAYGALQALVSPTDTFFHVIERIKNVTIHIVQPRISSTPSSYTMTSSALQEWIAGAVYPKVKAIMDGKGEYKPDDSTCKFCNAKHICPALRDKLFSDCNINELKPVSTLTVAEIAETFEKAMGIRAWLTAAEDYLKGQLLQSKPVPGFKLVEGRTVRKIINPADAANRLRKAGYKDAEFMKTELASLTAIEKLTGKAKFNDVLGDCVSRVAGQPSMVAASDPRTAYDPKSMFDGVTF